jgi:hypothetical protein
MLSRVEHATLRPVPLRPAGPVDPGEALAHVLASLPELDDDAARALALVEIAGRTREEASEQISLASEALADALYRSRKALRRSIFPLSASGWCERAERLLSDRIDGILTPPGPARLDVHLRNCERCVEHERRLSHAREKLVREFIDAHPESADAGPAERAGAALRVVEPVQVAAEEPAPAPEPEPAYDGPTRTVPGFGGPLVERVSEAAPELPHLSFAGPGGQSPIVIEPGAEKPSERDDDQPADPTIEQDIAPAEPADATPSEHDAEDPEPPVEERDKALATSLVWGTLTAASVGLAICALVITLLAVAGMDRIF